MQTCPRCGVEINGHALFCPRCGKRLSTTPAPEAQPEEVASESAAAGWRQDELEPVAAMEESPTIIAPSGETCGEPALTHAKSDRKSNRLTILACLVAGLVALGLICLVVGAIASGQRERQKQYSAEALAYFHDGMKRMDSGQYSQAIAFFESALRFDPTLTQAQDGIDRARARLEEKVTPIVAPTITPVPIAEELSAIEDAYAAGYWDQVITLGARFVESYPEQTTDELRGMLYEAYIANASLAVDQDQMGDAIRYLDQALVMKPDDETATYMRQMAVLYQEGSAAYGADWETAISTFEQLVALDGNYKDVYSKLYNAHLGYADEAAESGSWCVAAEQYARANELIADDAVSVKQVDAETACLNQPTELPPAAPGTFIGQLVRSDTADNDKIYIGGFVLSADAKAVKSVRVKISAFDWSAIATTDSAGHYSFDGLTTATTYTLELLDVTSLALEVPSELGHFYQVNFVQKQEDATAQAQAEATPTVP